SFVGRRPAATLLSFGDGRVAVEGGTLPEGVRTDAGMLAALEDVLRLYHSPKSDDLPPLHGGLMGYLGYDVVREVERLPDVPPADARSPGGALSLLARLAPFAPSRPRVTLLPTAYVCGDPTAADLDRIYDGAVGRLDQLASDGATPLDEPMVDPPSIDDE